MFDSTGRDAIGRVGAGSRHRSKAGRRLRVESLEARQMLTATLAPIADVTSPQFLGLQVPVDGGSGNAQTYSVTSDVPGVRATVAQGQFLTIGVAHASSGAGDVAVNGTMTFQLFDDLTPQTTARIKSLINGNATDTTPAVINGRNFYINRVFHRIASGFPTANTFIVQGGSVSGTGTGNAFRTPFNDEFVQSLAFTGTGQLAMANAGSDTNDSQFFITTGSPRSLDFKHTVFGQLVSGQEILTQLTQVAKGTDGSTPVSPVTITAATLSDTNPDGVIHIDTTLAPAGATANVSVTATDPTDNTTATRTFRVGVTPVSAGVVNSTPERPFLGPTDATITVGQGQTARFQLTAVSPDPANRLTYIVRGGTTTSGTTTTFTNVQNATANVDANGLVTVTPTPGFSGTIDLLVGVRGEISGSSTPDAPANFDTQRITLVVNNTTAAVPLRPIANSTSLVAQANTPSSLQVSGSTSNGTNATTFALLTQPTNGTITNFNPTTGTLTYTPNPGYAGPDAFTFEAQDATANLASFPATVRLNVTNATTGAVRYLTVNGTDNEPIANFLIVTPQPRKRGTNVIGVTQVGDNIQVTVNGVIDRIQPNSANVNRIIIYGSKVNDRVTVDPSVANLVTIDGGQGGRNRLRAGSGNSTLHGWFGQNTLRGGAGDDTLIGRRGLVKFRPSEGTDILFAGEPQRLAEQTTTRVLPRPATGTFFRFVNGRLVETANPYPRPRVIRNPPRSR